MYTSFRYLFISFFWLLSNFADASNPTISFSPLSSSIDQPIISSIFRDSDGLFWIGTQEGLYRFDGSASTEYNSDDTNNNWIPASDIRGISETKDGDLIVATYGGGLITWDKYAAAFHPLSSSSVDETSYLTNLYTSSGGNIWLGTEDRLLLYDSKLKSFADWPSKRHIASVIGRPFVFAESTQGIFLVGSSNGLIEISEANQKATKYDLSALDIQSAYGVTALEINGDGTLYIGTDTGHLALIDVNDGSVLAQGKLGSGPSILITDLEISEEHLLIATDDGLYYTENDLSNIDNISLNGSGLSNKDIYTLYSDDKYTYIGTYNGLDILSFSPFETLNSNNSALYNDVLAFAQDEHGSVWVGTYDGLYLHTRSPETYHAFKFRVDSEELIDQRVTAISYCDGLMWIGFYQGGVQSINASTGNINNLEIANAKEIFVTDIHAQSNPHNLWIATYSHGLIRATPDDIIYYQGGELLPERRVFQIHELENGNLLFSTTDKVYIYEEDRETVSEAEIDFGLNGRTPSVLSINEDKNGNVWFGTKDNGLFRLPLSSRKEKKLSLQQVNKASDFRYSTIYGIQIDRNGFLWASTQNGIIKLDPDGNLIKRFTTADGLQGNDFNFGASFTSREGLIYFGGVNGYNRFDPEEVEIDRTVSPMRLTNVFFPGNENREFQDLSDITEVHLTHKDKSVTFQFSVLDFVHPEENQFRYILRNFDSAWIENGARNTATYTNLPSGSYVLQVQGANSGGIWNREGIQLDIHVSPPPWFSWWAICSYVILLLFLWWCSLRIQRSYVLDRYSKSIEMEMIEADNRADDDIQEQVELQDEIIQSAYDHNIATLSLIRDSIRYQAERSPGRGELAHRSIKQIKALTHLEDSLYFQDGVPVVNLKKFGDRVISELLQKAPVDPETIITINEISSRLVPAEIASPAAIVLYELLENCFLHAFDEQSPANYIHLKMEGVEDRKTYTFAVRFFVGDNGRGLPRNVDQLTRGSGGIGIAHAIVRHFGGTLEFSDGEGSGISVTFPATEPI